jgi:two-component sensor histidine kinase
MMAEWSAAQSRISSLPLHLVEEIEHRVANEYAEAISGLSLAAAGAGQGEVRNAITRAAERLRIHADMHRALLPPTDGEVDLADYVSRMCASFSKATLADQQVLLSVETDEIWLSSARAWRVCLAIAELVRNSARHGLRGRSGNISVQLARTGDELFCRVCDNGSVRGNAEPGRGFSLVRALADELGGSVEWRFSQTGSSTLFRTPLEPA